MRLIDADALYELIDGGFDLDFDEIPETKAELLRMIDTQLTIEERKTGKWVDDERTIGGNCSVCGEYCGAVEIGENGIRSIWNYCPNCGAKMS